MKYGGTSNTSDVYRRAQEQATRQGSWHGVSFGAPTQGAFSAAPAAPPKDPIHGAMDAAQDEAFRVRDTEDRNQAQQNEFLTGEFNAFSNTPAISDAELSQQFGMSAEAAGRDANQAYSNLRESLGGGGFSGATGAGLASQIELAKLGQLTGASRDLRMYKARLDSDKGLQRLQAAGELAGFRNQSPSMLGVDALGARAGMEVTLEGIRAEERAANAAAKASKKAGKSSAFGSAIGGAFSAI